MEVLKSIAKENVVESELKLGKLKINLADGNRKNIEKTIMFIKRNLKEDDYLISDVREMLINLVGLESELLGDLNWSKGEYLGLGNNLDYLNFLSAEYDNEDVRNMVHIDMSGKLAKSKNGVRYSWKNKEKGRFVVYDGKRAMAVYKLYKELAGTMSDTSDVFDLKSYLHTCLRDLKWGYNRAIDEIIFEAVMDIYQDDLNIKSMENYEKQQSGDYAKAFMTKKNINKNVLEKMDSTLFTEYGFNFVEIDNDTDLEKLNQVEQEWKDIYSKLPKINGAKTDLRFRKLGKHNATGLYYPTQHCLCVDIRSVSSMIHEYGHLVDYELFDNVISLSPEFREVIRSYSLEVSKLSKESYVSKKSNYYTTPTEVFARGFELYMSKRIETSFMKSKEEYRERDEYKCFTDENLTRLEGLLNELIG